VPTSPTSVRNDNAHPQSEVTSGEITMASVWSVFYLIAIVLAVTGQTLGPWIELAARY
jgi:hypothetical protein